VIPPFHLAFPVHDLETARRFYLDVHGCREGRNDDTRVDFDLYGHQIVAHLTDTPIKAAAYSEAEGHDIFELSPGQTKNILYVRLYLHAFPAPALRGAQPPRLASNLKCIYDKPSGYKTA